MKIILFHFVRESQLFTLQIKLFLTNWIPTGDKVSNKITILRGKSRSQPKAKSAGIISKFKSPRELQTRLCFNEPRKVITLTELPDGSRWSQGSQYRLQQSIMWRWIELKPQSLICRLGLKFQTGRISGIKTKWTT